MKKTKKEEKPPAAGNQCQNERRHREGESTYIAELAELIPASVTDMNTFSVKPDKCAILQETVNQIRRIKEEERAASDAVQQSHVSSSRPLVLASDVLGPLLLEALDGFLFVVNGQGLVELVSLNITQYLKYLQDDVNGKSIYNIIHVGDHAQFSSSLVPMSAGSDVAWPLQNPKCGKGRTFNCRMLVKPPSEDEDDVADPTSHVPQYETMQISAVLQPLQPDGQSCLVCIARRLPPTEKSTTMLGTEEFTTKQDLNGKILSCDTSGISPNHYNYPDFVGQTIQDYCHVNDIQNFNKHIQEVKKTSSNTSGVYRFKLQEKRYVFVRTKSKLFKNPFTGEAEYVISTHSIIRECDSDVELKGSASTSLMKSIIGQSHLNTNITARVNMGMLSSLTSPGLTLGGSSLSLSDTDPFDVLGTSPTWDPFSTDNGHSSTGSTLTTGTNSSQSAWVNMTNKAGKAAVQRPQQLPITQPQTGGAKPSAATGNFQSQRLYSGVQKSPGAATPGQISRQLSLNSMTPQAMAALLYPSQRSPGGVADVQRNAQLARKYQVMAKAMMSPPPPAQGQGVGSNMETTWSRLQGPTADLPSPTSSLNMQQNPLLALQSMDSPAPSVNNNHNIELSSRNYGQLSSMLGDNLAMLHGNNLQASSRRAKLCQLLTRTTNFSQAEATVTAADRKNVTKSAADSVHQSPQPGPGHSPPDKPQSTSSEDEISRRSSSAHGGLKKEGENLLLKELLSQDEDDVLEPKLDITSPRPTVVNGELTKEMEKNEAEAKKPSNALLKQLLSDTMSESSSNERENRVQADLLQKLLHEEVMGLSPPVESTSSEQEAITSSGTMPPIGQPSINQQLVTTPSASPRQLSNLANSQSIQQDMYILKELFNDTNQKAPADSLTPAQGHNLDTLLASLWEKDNSHVGRTREMEMRLQRHKRKASHDVDSTDGIDSEPSTSTGNGFVSQSDLTKKNAILTQLLSKKTSRESVVNTQITANPSAVPQQRLPVNLKEKIMKITAEASINMEKESSKMPNLRDNPRTNPNTPFPGNTKNENGRGSSFNPMDYAGLDNNAQFQQQLDQLQQMLSAPAPSSTSGENNIANAPSAMEVDTNAASSSDSHEHLLMQRILQEASELQNDVGISGGQMSSAINTAAQMSTNNVPTSSTSSVSWSGSAGTPSTTTKQQLQQMPATMTDDSSLLSQLEMVLGASLTDIDSLLGIQAGGVGGQFLPADPNERMAIDAIQQQLMSEDPGIPSKSTGGAEVISTAGYVQQQPGGVGAQHGLPSSGVNSSFPQQQPHAQQLQRPTSFTQPSAAFNQQQRGPRLPQQAAGSVASALQQTGGSQHRMLIGNSRAVQVRQSLLLQQRMKMMKGHQAQQDHQRLLMQQHPQFKQFSPGQQQRFQQQANIATLDSPAAIQKFPENFGELMNSGNAPNVTLQRNQSLPGPMSPRFGPGVQQQPAMLGPGPASSPSQLSPHFNQSGQSQWNVRPPGQNPLGTQVPQSNQQFSNLQRHRAMQQGPGVPSSNRFQYPDGQFPTGSPSGQLGMFGQQSPQQQASSAQHQQQIFAQNRLMQQRQMTLPPGRGSPRTPHSPFGNSPDPLLMSPHSMSPNPPRQSSVSQVSPSYNQPAATNFSQGLPSYSPSMSPGGGGQGFGQQAGFDPSLPASSQQNSMASQSYDFNMLLDGPGMDGKKSIGPLTSDLGSSTATSQYVKQELRNICAARTTEKQLQHSAAQHSAAQNSAAQHSAAQNSAMAAPPQMVQMEADDGEIPQYILEEISELQQASSLVGMSSVVDPDPVNSARAEARLRYAQFNSLANPDRETEDAEKKATNLFRKQLTTNAPSLKGNHSTQKGLTSHNVNVVQKEPRSQVDDIRPADQKNSLLQQLLSE